LAVSAKNQPELRGGEKNLKGGVEKRWYDVLWKESSSFGDRSNGNSGEGGGRKGGGREAERGTWEGMGKLLWLAVQGVFFFVEYCEKRDGGDLVVFWV